MAILANEKVLTLDYWKYAHTLSEGDYVFNREGKLVRIKLIQKYRANECYQVVFNDHLTVSGDKNLRFPLENTKYRKRLNEYKGKRQFLRPLKDTKLEDLLTASLRNNNNRLAFSVPSAKPLELPTQTLPVPPFIFGFWFFNRRSTKKLAAPRGKWEEVERQFKEHGYKITVGKKINTGEREFSVYPSIESQLMPDIPWQIPNNYLLGSNEQRLELLRGILHAKHRQYSVKRDRFRFTSQHQRIFSQIQFLVESLGHKTTCIFDETKEYYTISFKSRLKLLDEQVSPPLKVHNDRRYIKQIEPMGEQLCVHIETEGADNSFLVGAGFISCL